MSNKVSKIEILKVLNKTSQINDAEIEKNLIETFNKIIEQEERTNKYVKTYSLSKKIEKSFLRLLRLTT